MSKLQELKLNLQPGQVYRRAELEQWSTAVDRHLKALQTSGELVKLSGGLYYYPKKTTFGEAPAEDRALVQTFLKDNRFLLSSPNIYNALGVGTTQLYNETVVYNHKRHGKFTLGGRTFNFRREFHFPDTLTPEFLLVDLVNNLKKLAEDHEQVLKQVKRKAASMHTKTLADTVRKYGRLRTRKFFSSVLQDPTLQHAI